MCEIGSGDVLVAYPSDNEVLHQVVADTVDLASNLVPIDGVERLRALHQELTDEGDYPFGHEVLRLRVPEGFEVRSTAELHRMFSFRAFGATDPEHLFTRDGFLQALTAPDVPFHAAPSGLWSSSGTTAGHTFTMQAAHTAALSALGAATPRSGSGVTIGVLDSGFDSAGRSQSIAERLNAIEYDTQTLRNDVHDGLGHGSFVVDLISSVVTNADYKIVKVFNDNGCSTDWHILLGLSLLHDCDIVNLSIESGLGGYKYKGCDQMGQPSVSALFDAVVTKSLENSAQIYVAAAGNTSGPQLAYPARFGDVVAVKAVNSKGALSAFSSTGTAGHAVQVHPHVVVAPGGDHGAHVSQENLALDAAGKGQWGTSFAAAYVSGVLASRVASARATGQADDRASILADMEASCAQDPSWYTAGHGSGMPQAS